MLPLWAIFGACSVSADFIMLICVLFSCPPLLAGELELFYFPYFFFSSRVVFMAGPKLATVPWLLRFSLGKTNLSLFFLCDEVLLCMISASLCLHNRISFSLQLWWNSFRRHFCIRWGHHLVESVVTWKYCTENILTATLAHELASMLCSDAWDGWLEHFPMPPPWFEVSMWKEFCMCVVVCLSL